MGLDMFAYAVKGEAATGAPLPSREEWNEIYDKHPAEEFHYWRKHPDLHGWMENLYRTRGGGESFNCVPLRLYPEDLDALEKDIMSRELPRTEGFFFGQSRSDDREGDLEFIEKARERIDEGFYVYYDSWW